MSQLQLLDEPAGATPPVRGDNSTTFAANLSLPIHRWFRYSAGFSATWVASEIARLNLTSDHVVLDPFAGAGTTLLECEFQGVSAIGLDPHPFVSRVAQAKLAWRSDITDYTDKIQRIIARANKIAPDLTGYPDLIHECYSPESLASMDRLRRAWVEENTDDNISRLAWLTLAAIIRPTSKAGTAQWQYVLPRKTKKKVLGPDEAFQATSLLFARDMSEMQTKAIGPKARFFAADARDCSPVADASVDCVLTSPPYPNNFDYADATRLEMCFFQEITGWGDLQDKVRRHLVRACSQHVPPKSIDIPEILRFPELAPIRDELTVVCDRLSAVRLEKGGKKSYNNMIACYYLDMARTWQALRRVCRPGADVCFVIGDSAPYGVYAPAVEWMAALALGAGFKSWTFEKIRDRNLKWKNRKHRVPLQEGRLWVKG